MACLAALISRHVHDSLGYVCHAHAYPTHQLTLLSGTSNLPDCGRHICRSPGTQGAVGGQRAASGGFGGGGGAAGEERASLGLADDRGFVARGGEGAPLGRSPQRGAFVPANHLLNFQYDSRAAVGAPALKSHQPFKSFIYVGLTIIVHNNGQRLAEAAEGLAIF